MARKHISRKYSAHRQSVVRPQDEYFAVEIFSYDHKDTVIYSKYAYDYLSTDNAVEVTRNNWTCLESENKSNRFSANCNYVVDEFAEYRFDFLYEKKTPLNFTGFFIILDSQGNKVADEEVIFDGDTDNIKRKTFFFELKPDTYTVRYRLPNNVWFMGAIHRKIKVWKGDSLDSAGTNIMVTSANVSHAGKIRPAELSMTIAYDDAFECDYSRSGFYMDYRDEINCYVRDEYGETKQIFGGYISSIVPNDTNTTMTITGLDRLSDGDKKYIMEAMVLKGGDKEMESYNEDMIHSFEQYGAALEHLCSLLEETLDNNINENYFVAGEHYSEGLTGTIGTNQVIKNVIVSNMIAEMHDNFATIRNEAKSEDYQWAYLYSTSQYGNEVVDITDYPIFYLTYGLGDPKQELNEGE